MNERIIKLAEEAGLLNCIDGESPQNYVVHMEAGLAEIKKFAELIRADEREACSLICQAAYLSYYSAGQNKDPIKNYYEDLMKYIRARGEVK